VLQIGSFGCHMSRIQVLPQKVYERVSKAGSSAQIPVDYTEIRHVHKPSGAKPGFVTYDKIGSFGCHMSRIQVLPQKVYERV
jgi:hypothetical protein